MNDYKLLTPGPLTTTYTVKEQMLFDRCTWDDDYKGITQKIRRQLLEIAGVSSDKYTSVLMQGSGSFGVEAVMTSAAGNSGKCLIIANGAYGERIVKMAEYMGMDHTVYRTGFDCQPDVNEIRGILHSDEKITHVVMVHCETTTGILNPLEDVANVAKEFGKYFILDAMSSFGGVPMDIGDLGVDYLISSSNKCIQGVPGFSFVIARTESLMKCKGVSRSLCLDLYEQWVEMDRDGKWRYTSPTHVVAAFSQAIDELIEEGGVAARHDRYKANNIMLRNGLSEIGIRAYIDEAVQSPIITTFLFPSNGFDFTKFYGYVKARGFVIYPGKLTDVDTFRVGNIGEIYKEDIQELCSVIKSYMEVISND